MSQHPTYRYPRRRLIRGVMRGMIRTLFAILSDFHVEGKENLPAAGPLIIAANHFYFIDPVAMIGATPYPLDFISGTVTPGSPPWADFLPTSWGVYRVARGTGSTEALKASLAVLGQGGVLGMFPEGGSWAHVLRPARPGVAYLAALTGAPILPAGIDGALELFPSLKSGRRTRLTVRFGKAFGPVSVSGRGRERRRQLDEIGHEIMRHIAELIPPERRGHYSDDPAIREAAKGTEIYPWEDSVEGDIERGAWLKELPDHKPKPDSDH
jgi:1-acyl-sn-glycerol-3-phosphate acyltransferase